MGQRSFIAFIFLISSIIFNARSGANETALSTTHCTLDTLRNAQKDVESPAESSSIVRFEFLDCDLPVLPDAILTDLPGTQSINFTHSNLSTISPFAFSGLRQLETLTIVGNPNLTVFQSWTPHNLDQLVKLDAHTNGIFELDTSALHRLPKLMHLNLNDNLIQEIPLGFFDFSLNIETLDLSSNLLSRIESHTFRALLRLIDLNLAHNKMNHMDPYSFTTITRLKRLNLEGNQISTINSVIFHNLAHLEFLNLHANTLDEDSIKKEAFQQNSQLLHLDVSNNWLSTIHFNALDGLISLQVFNASDNQIVSIPSNSFKDLGNLKHLDISYNKFVRLLDNQFSFLTSIESINVSNNQIDSIQNFTFTDLPTLHELDLSNNQLHTDHFLEQIPPMNSLNLAHNRYQQINLAAFKNTVIGHLNDNIWNCSWLLHALGHNEHRITNIQFGFDFDDEEHKSLEKPLIAEEVECYDYRTSIDQPTVKRIVIVHSDGCGAGKSTEIKKKSAISTYPRTFSKLLNEEFDYKACLLWTVLAVCFVIGLVRLGKFYLDRSEKKSERYRRVQQEKVLKDIDEYFAKSKQRV